jgi:hypothetical protein
MALPIPDVEPVTSAFWLLRPSVLVDMIVSRVMNETRLARFHWSTCSLDAMGALRPCCGREGDCQSLLHSV